VSLNQFEPFCIYRNRQTGATAHDIRAALPKRLTVDRGYRCRVSRPNGTTLFREIEFVPRRDILDAEALALLAMRDGVVSEANGYPAGIAAALIHAVENNWTPKRFHLVFHSSGWDSRILSAIIRRLYKRNGATWLGRVLFACLGNESAAFADIMQIEGWSKQRWVAIEDLGPLVAQMIDLTAAGRWLNGVVCQAFDCNWLLVEHLQAIGLVPDDEDIQIISGRNETLMGATMPGGNGLDASWAEAYDAFLSLSRYKGQVIFPFTGYGVIETALRAQERFDWRSSERENKCNFRRGLAEYLWPGLAAIPRGTIVVPPITHEQAAKMRAQYAASWYGREVWKGAERDATDRALGHHPWWGAWSAAALCEALLQEGYALTVS
jgi:hypothetical protein